MATIEIDFDVFKSLTAMRASETVTYNDIIRGLLNMNGTPVLKKAEVPSVFQAFSDMDVRVLADGGDASAKTELARRGVIDARPSSSSFAREAKDWTTKGVTFPAGTEFRATYKGHTINGHVESGALLVNGKPFHSPSAAAVSITRNPVNGWIFWECKLPGQSRWQILKSLRK